MTQFEAVAIAEGFEESPSLERTLEAWSVIAKTGIWRGLQGFFGRTLAHLVDQGVMDWDGNIDWDAVSSLREG